MDKIPFLKQNSGSREEWEAAEWLEEFRDFLMGETPEGIYLGKGHHPKMSIKKAQSIIWYLQEHLSVFPDTFENCTSCGRIFNSEREGIYWETKGKHWCGSCDYLAPLNYDNNNRR